MLYRDLGKETTDELLDLFESGQKGRREVKSALCVYRPTEPYMGTKGLTT